MIMQNPIDKMRKAFENKQAIVGLKKFAEKCELDHLEKDWQKFISTSVKPAFAKVELEFFRKRNIAVLDLPEQPGNPGFKVRDLPNSEFPNTEFQFWIQLQGRLPMPHALRIIEKTSGALVVATHSLSSKPNFTLTDVSENDVVSTIVDAYEKSRQSF